MNTKITFLLLLVLLIILMLFYYIDLESNIIILLGVVIVLILHNLLKKKEHFNINEQAARLESQIDSLIAVAGALKARSSGGDGKGKGGSNDVILRKSCPFEPTTGDVDGGGDPTLFENGLNPGLGSSFKQISATDIQTLFNPKPAAGP